MPREAVDAPSLDTFQARLGKAVSSLVWLKMSQLIAGRLGKRTFKVSSNPNHSLILRRHKIPF